MQMINPAETFTAKEARTGSKRRGNLLDCLCEAALVGD
jgi:hypothetical protein